MAEELPKLPLYKMIGAPLIDDFNNKLNEAVDKGYEISEIQPSVVHSGGSNYKYSILMVLKSENNKKGFK